MKFFKKYAFRNKKRSVTLKILKLFEKPKLRFK